MQFGIFDHMDRSGLPLAEQYSERLQLIEAYDRTGFYAYHLAEHHGTPLGLAPAPSVFLAAVAARSTRLRFGPLVYTLSIYHPLRAIEEICMLDQLSNGRLELGIGRGISPIEMGFYGAGDDAAERYEEVVEIILQGLGRDRLDYAGKHFRFAAVPLEIAPLQQPHPPLWYGVATPERAGWAAARGMNVVTNGPAAAVRGITDAYRDAWARESQGELPHLGMSRHVLITEREAEAVALARPAYRQWFDHLLHLWRIHKRPIPLNFPDNFDDARDAGLCLVGTPDNVADMLATQTADAGVNYLLCRIAFGNLPLAASLDTVAAFSETCMTATTPERV